MYNASPVCTRSALCASKAYLFYLCMCTCLYVCTMCIHMYNVSPVRTRSALCASKAYSTYVCMCTCMRLYVCIHCVSYVCVYIYICVYPHARCFLLSLRYVIMCTCSIHEQELGGDGTLASTLSHMPTHEHTHSLTDIFI